MRALSKRRDGKEKIRPAITLLGIAQGRGGVMLGWKPRLRPVIRLRSRLRPMFSLSRSGRVRFSPARVMPVVNARPRLSPFLWLTWRPGAGDKT